MESSSSAVRSWRMAFLTLRDETLTPHPPPASLVLLRDLILCHFDTLIGATSQLPPYEVTADVLLLVELASAISEGEEGADACLQICHMIHDVCCRVRLEINMSSWTFMLNFIENVVDWSLVRPNSKGLSLGSAARMKIAAEILEILRQTVKAYGRNGSDLENSRLVRLLLCIISYLHGELPKSSYSNETRWRDTDSETSSKLNNLWEMQTIAFSMIGDALSRLGSSISPNLWQCVVEVLRKVMDYVASKSLIVENTIMSRFYTTLLNCLHLSLTDPKGSISGHDLCNADPKSLSSFWTLLLPENDVLQPRKYQATLMTCLLFDPVLKIRLASASALGAMLDGHSLVFLQVAEFKESVKCGSFTTLSSSLGKILMQLHTGILYMIQHETHTGLLASSFKVLMLLIAATPYNRMPAELLPTILASLRTKIMGDLVLRVENTGLLATAISCLEASFLTSPPSVPVKEMLKEDISNGRALANRGLSLIFLLLQLSEQGSHLIVGFEALQVSATSVTCFAGMTSTVFFSLIEEKQDFIISSAISAALHDKATSVRSAACRAIGVISCLPQIFCSTRVLNEFICAAEINTHDPVTSVRITASWALANICGSLRQRVDELHLDMPSGEVTYRDSISILVETALRLTKDGDKKAGFLEEWMKMVMESGDETSSKAKDDGTLKRRQLFRAIKSLIEVYENRSQHYIAQRFKMLAGNCF